ncbi:translation initiation factor IF-2-like isoform X2 [Canis lupus dingo]|uniref:translation initiation factor IF-2-like isoform X2 n=1 Tax=Canis lupus dingo TaxID=286419 RepID=UPI000DC74F57|nr:translation initiation factor IF-2-like isoform X2 [Canis lupus dingo]
MAGLAAPWPAGSARLCPPVWVSGAGASRGRGGLGAPVPRPPRRVPPRSPRVAHVAPAAAARVRQVRSPLCGRLWGAGRPRWRLRRAPEGRGRGPSRRLKERAARWAEGPAAPPRGPGPAVPRLLRPGRPLARRLPGACSPRVPGTGRAAPRRPSAPARAAELGPQEPPARTCPRAGPPQPPPDAARWLRALDVITLSAVRAPDFVSRVSGASFITRYPRKLPTDSGSRDEPRPDRSRVICGRPGGRPAGDDGWPGLLSPRASANVMGQTSRFFVD